MRQPKRDGAKSVVIPNDPLAARRVQDDIESLLKAFRFEDRDIFGIKLSLEEALVNAMKHGNRMDPAKRVFIRYAIDAQRCDIAITDEGPGFEPENVPDPCCSENLERPGGRGLFLMRHYMTEVQYHPPGNRLTMCKVRNAKAG